jgi:predicted MarR family transcription regulator
MGIRKRCGEDAVNKPLDDKDTGQIVDRLAPLMTQFELAMIVARNAQEQWVLRCAAAAGMKGYSTTDLLVLHMVGYGPKRLADICFSLNIEDTHIVSYALKKLQRARLVESARIGKDTFFQPTEEGQKFIDDYKAMRKRFLIRALAKFSSGELELEQLAEMLRVLSGLYEQAARSAENSMAV